METVQRHSWFRRQSPQRLRVVLLSLVIVIVGFQTTDRIFSIILVNILLCLAHIAVLWIPDRLVGTDRRRIVIVFVLWIAMAVPWGVFHNVSISISLLFYLIAYIALRLPSSKSSLLAAGVIAGDAAIMLWTGEPYDFIWMYSIFHAAIYIFVWGDRVRREAEDVSKRHFRELGETHAKLERTHLELRKAHGELEQAHTQLEEAAGRSLRYAVLEERSRIARDIHDSIGHGLTSVIVQLQAMPYVLRTNPAEADQMVATVLDVARRCLTEVRSVVHQMAADEGLPGLAGLKNLIAQVRSHSSLHIALDVSGPTSRWKPDISELLYRVLQEALTNVIRHSGASRVDIGISEGSGELIMTVKDDGAYTGEPPLVPGFGLSGMKARCEREGGIFDIRASMPHGVIVAVRVPLEGNPVGGGGE